MIDTPVPPPAAGWIGDAVTGAALGAFVGALLGLSLTPGTTSNFVGALVAVLATFFGLVTTSATVPIQPARGRIAAFCLAGLLATVGAVYARTHNLLSPAPSYLADLAQELRTLGYKEDKIREMIETRYFPKSGSTPPFPSSTLPGAQQTGTFITIPEAPALK